MTGGPDDAGTLRIDIVSDVVCPWCVVGYLQLSEALRQRGQVADIHWHPFELNPAMPPEGENLRDHIMRKYGSTREQSQQARDRLAEVGRDLGFTFAFNDQSRIVNTFRAHQLLDRAAETGNQTALKLTLFEAYFTHGRDVSQTEVLVDVAERAGLDPSEAREIVETDARLGVVRQKQKFWTDQGISGVPGMVFDGKYLVTGAQGVDNYARFLQELARAGAEASAQG